MDGFSFMSLYNVPIMTQGCPSCSSSTLHTGTPGHLASAAASTRGMTLTRRW